MALNRSRAASHFSSTPVEGNARRASSRRGRQRLVVRALEVRPYTTRKGDTIESIADKRGFEVDELRRLNHSVNVSSLDEGVTILIPSAKLSDRDREIIDGIGRRYRTYPVRKGETVEDIISARGITMEELKRLNPDVDLKAVKTNMVLKLPSGKYTVREKEMLMGVLHAPPEFFQSKGFVASSSAIGIAVLVGLYFWWTNIRNKKE